MANMNLPGVRRIEALIDVLKQKEKAEIAELNKTLPSGEDIEALVDAEFGLTEIRRELKSALESAKKVVELLNEVTGENQYVQVSFNYRSRSSAYRIREGELTKKLREEPVAEIKRKYAEKESALWLVESIEQAKEIVYGSAT